MPGTCEVEPRGNRSFPDKPLGRESLETRSACCFKMPAPLHGASLFLFSFFFRSCVSLTFNAQPPLPPPSLWRTRRRYFSVGPVLSLLEYEQTDVTAGRPYVTSLSDLYALIIPSRGSNIDILALNTQTLQSASAALGIIRLPATCGAGTPEKVLDGWAARSLRSLPWRVGSASRFMAAP